MGRSSLGGGIPFCRHVCLEKNLPRLLKRRDRPRVVFVCARELRGDPTTRIASAVPSSVFAHVASEEPFFRRCAFLRCLTENVSSPTVAPPLCVPPFPTFHVRLCKKPFCGVADVTSCLPDGVRTSNLFCKIEEALMKGDFLVLEPERVSFLQARLSVLQRFPETKEVVLKQGDSLRILSPLFSPLSQSCPEPPLCLLPSFLHAQENIAPHRP